MDPSNYVMRKVNLMINLQNEQIFYSEIQGKYTKLAKIVKISISFNQLVFPANIE